MPQRFLRPGITTSKRFNRVTFDAQSFYVRLLTLVDDFGRYEADFMLLRSHVFPLGSPDGKDISLKTIENICEQLSANDLVVFYVDVSEKEFLQIVRWQERARAETSRFPAFDDTCKQLLRNPAESCGILPPSPSPSPSPLHHRHTSSSVPLPTAFPDGFKEEWQFFVEHRKKKRAPMTDHAQELILQTLSQRPADAIEAVKTAICSNWTGFKWEWFDNSKRQNNGTTNQRHPTESTRNLGTKNAGRASDYANAAQKLPDA